MVIESLFTRGQWGSLYGGHEKIVGEVMSRIILRCPRDTKFAEWLPDTPFQPLTLTGHLSTALQVSGEPATWGVSMILINIFGFYWVSKVLGAKIGDENQ